MTIDQIIDRLAEARTRAVEMSREGELGYVEAYGALATQVEFALFDLRILRDTNHDFGIGIE